MYLRVLFVSAVTIYIYKNYTLYQENDYVITIGDVPPRSEEVVVSTDIDTAADGEGDVNGKSVGLLFVVLF